MHATMHILYPILRLVATRENELINLKDKIASVLTTEDTVVVDWENVNIVVGSQYGRFSLALRQIDPNHEKITFINMNASLATIARTILAIFYQDKDTEL